MDLAFGVMDLAFAVIFLAVGGACFYFLVHEDRVRSLMMLRIAFVDLGLSLIAAAFAMLGGPYFEVIMVANALAYLFLGAATICLVFVAHPVTLSVPQPQYRRHRASVSPEELSQIANQP